MLLHFLSHQDNYGLISEKYGVARSSFHLIVNRLLKICVVHLMPKYLKWPNAERQREMSSYFLFRNGFPGVIGAIDGTHITIAKPPTACFPDDYYSNRTKKFSMLLQVTALEDLSLSSIDVGQPGRCHDATMF